MALELIQRARPALLVARPRVFRLEARVGEGHLGPSIAGFEVNLDAGHFTDLLRHPAADPLPAHDEPFGLNEFEILAGALMFGSVEPAEAHSKSTADSHIGLGKKDRPAARPPPLSNALGRGQPL